MAATRLYFLDQIARFHELVEHPTKPGIVVAMIEGGELFARALDSPLSSSHLLDWSRFSIDFQRAVMRLD